MYLKEKIIISTAAVLLLSAPISLSIQEFERKLTPKVCVKWGERQVTRPTSFVQDGVLITAPKTFTINHCLEREYVES